MYSNAHALNYKFSSLLLMSDAVVLRAMGSFDRKLQTSLHIQTSMIRLEFNDTARPYRSHEKRQKSYATREQIVTPREKQMYKRAKYCSYNAHAQHINKKGRVVYKEDMMICKKMILLDGLR